MPTRITALVSVIRPDRIRRRLRPTKPAQAVSTIRRSTGRWSYRSGRRPERRLGRVQIDHHRARKSRTESALASRHPGNSRARIRPASARHSHGRRHTPGHHHIRVRLRRVADHHSPAAADSRRVAAADRHRTAGAHHTAGAHRTADRRTRGRRLRDTSAVRCCWRYRRGSCQPRAGLKRTVPLRSGRSPTA